MKLKNMQWWNLTNRMKLDTNLTVSLLLNYFPPDNKFSVQLHLFKHYLYLFDHYKKNRLKFVKYSSFFLESWGKKKKTKRKPLALACNIFH